MFFVNYIIASKVTYGFFTFAQLYVLFQNLFNKIEGKAIPEWYEEILTLHHDVYQH